MSIKRQLARRKWLQIRKKNKEGQYEPSWIDFKKKYLTENPSHKTEE